MGRVIGFRGGKHREVQELLPWYLNGQLDPAEEDRVRAHLSVCAECQAEVRFQERLGPEIAHLPLNVEHSWSRMRRMVEADRAPAGRPRPEPGWGGRSWAPIGVAWRTAPLWGVGALTGALLVAVVAYSPPFGATAQYHALGARVTPTSGNVMVIFRPDTPERSLRGALLAIHARLVDGPTEADAYVLSVPAPEREAALAALRARPEVVTAQPIDPGPSR
ncbi:MAG TPA: zf-HC2 domain-containing protein [Phenylobacterium sp.]|nr:zf-HC2 domain-containing protein [Phenylobacterium sp.]